MSDVLIGNLVADPELRFTPNGKAVAKVRVAVTDRVKQGDTWVNGETSFHDVTIWQAQAENATQYLHKGQRVIAAGYWKEREWESDEGTKTNREFVANDIGPSLKFGGPN